MATNIHAQHREGEAQPLYQEALEIRRRALSEDHPDTTTSLGDLAANLASRGRYREAQTLPETALAVRLRLHGEGHPNTAFA